MKPLVSIIIPCYNAEKFIAQTIQSVLNQTYRPIELLVVNDGSTDNSLSVIKSFDSSELIIIDKQNSGVSDSRNIGISNAKGEYISFLDADDLWDADNLEMKVNYLEQNLSHVLVYSSVTEFNSENGNKNFVHGSDYHATESLIHFKPLIHCPAAALIRKKSIENSGTFDTALSTSADWEMWLRLSLEGPFGYLSTSLVKYRIHANQMHRNVPLFRKDMEYAFRKFQFNKQVFPTLSDFRKAYSNLYLIIALSFFKENNLFSGISSLMKSLWFSCSPLLKRIFINNKNRQ